MYKIVWDAFFYLHKKIKVIFCTVVQAHIDMPLCMVIHKQNIQDKATIWTCVQLFLQTQTIVVKIWISCFMCTFSCKWGYETFFANYLLTLERKKVLWSFNHVENIHMWETPPPRFALSFKHITNIRPHIFYNQNKATLQQPRRWWEETSRADAIQIICHQETQHRPSCRV